MCGILDKIMHQNTHIKIFVIIDKYFYMCYHDNVRREYT